MNGQPVVPTALATNVPVLSSRQLAPFEYRILLGPLFPSDYARFFFELRVFTEGEHFQSYPSSCRMSSASICHVREHFHFIC